MKKFVTTTYTITSDKIRKRPLKFVMISDLHNVVIGENNKEIFQKIRECGPDAILIAGDLIIGKTGESFEPAKRFLLEAVKLAPVIYAPGNHEQRMEQCICQESFAEYEEAIKEMGVIYLRNDKRTYGWKGESCVIHSLDIPPYYYERGPGKHFSVQKMEQFLGKPEKNAFSVLLAHTPRYGETYFDWGADLIFSGHYHGGVIRIPGLGPLIGPDFSVFSKYGYGKKERKQQCMITGAGLGEHTLPLRINNPRELVVVYCLPKEV